MMKHLALNYTQIYPWTFLFVAAMFFAGSALLAFANIAYGAHASW